MPDQIPNSTNVGKSVVASAIKSESARDLLIELGEVGLDQFLEEGVWRDLPGLRMLFGPVKICLSIRDKLFVRKVVGFLGECRTFTDDEKAEFVREHLNVPAKAQRLRDALVLTLDRLDDLEKPEIVARMFAALVRRKIELETFRRLAAAIDTAYIEDLNVLAKQPRQLDDITAAYLPNLLRSGLSEISPNVDAGDATWDGSNYRIAYRISLLGRVFIGCANENYLFGTDT